MPPPFDQFHQATQVPHPRVVVNGNIADADLQANTELHNKPGRAMAESFLSAQASLLLDLPLSPAAGPLPPALRAQHPCRSLTLNPYANGLGAGVYNVANDTIDLTLNHPQIGLLQTASHEMNHGMVRALGLESEKAILQIMQQPLQCLPPYPSKAPQIADLASQVLPGPAELSPIRGQFYNQASKKFDTITSYEMGAYISESLFCEIRDTGSADGFIARVRRYQDIITEAGRVDRKNPPSQALQDLGLTNHKQVPEFIEYVSKAQEIVAVATCITNTKLIDILATRGQPEDIQLGTVLRNVNRELMPAYAQALDRLQQIQLQPKPPAALPVMPPPADIRAREVLDQPHKEAPKIAKDDIKIRDGDIQGKEVSVADSLRKSLRRNSFSGDPRYTPHVPSSSVPSRFV